MYLFYLPVVVSLFSSVVAFGQAIHHDTKPRKDAVVKSHKKFSPVPCTQLIEYKTAFAGRVRTAPGGINYPSTTYRIPTAELQAIAATSKYMLAIFGLSKGSLTIDFLASDKDGTRLNEVGSDTYAAIKAKHDALKSSLAKGLPLGVKSFPLVIKMEAINLLRMTEHTGEPYIIFFPGIESTNTKTSKLTICAAASGDGTSISTRHSNDIPCEETWPDENFTYYGSMRDADVILR
jgi:hypothetical protein